MRNNSRDQIRYVSQFSACGCLLSWHHLNTLIQKLVMWLQTLPSASNVAVHMQADRTKCLVTVLKQLQRASLSVGPSWTRAALKVL